MKKFICLLSVVFALSCAKEKSSVPVFNLAEAGKVNVNPDFVLNDIADSVTYLQLEGSDSIFHRMPTISSINDNGDYSIADQMNNGTISIYNKEGKLLSYFSRMGRGNGEYININSLLYDGEDKIEVLDEDKGVIYQYNKRGEYKSKVDIKGAFLVNYLDDGKYLSLMAAYNDKNVNNFLSIYDANGNVCDSFLPIDTTKLDGTVTRASSMTRFGDGYNFPINTFNSGDVYYHYNMKDKSITEICRFDVGQYKLKQDVFRNGGNPSDYIIMIEPYMVENYLFVQFFNCGVFCTDVWDMTTQKMIARRMPNSTSAGELGFKLSDGERIGLGFRSFTTHNNQFIFICDPAKLAGKIPQNIDPEGNSVIVTVKLKK